MRKILNYTFKQKLTNKYDYGFYLIDLYKKIADKEEYNYIFNVRVYDYSKGFWFDKIRNFLKNHEIDFIDVDLCTWTAIKTKEDLEIIRKLLKVIHPELGIDVVIKVSSLESFRKKCLKYQNDMQKRFNMFCKSDEKQLLEDLVSDFKAVKRRRKK